MSNLLLWTRFVSQSREAACSHAETKAEVMAQGCRRIAGQCRAEGGACLIPAIVYEAPPMPQYEGSNEAQEQAGADNL